MKNVPFRTGTALVMIVILFSCSKVRIKNNLDDYLNGKINFKGLSIDYPKSNTLFPLDFQSPTFHWTDSTGINTGWYACISDSVGTILLKEFTEVQKWKPDSIAWEELKSYANKKLQLTILGYNGKNKKLSGSSMNFRISSDPVGAEIFFRAVTLPFSYAVSNVHTIEWYLGNVKGGKPRKMLDNMPVCANCHSFSNEEVPKLAMDVDYGFDKGSYIVKEAKDTCSMRKDDIISWSNFKKDESEPTFGLLSQISSSGRYVLSTVKDLSVFAAVDDNLEYSQLFFPIKGIIGIYDVQTKTFSELNGANEPKYVQSNPVWSPDGKKVIFARTDAYINEKVKEYGNALLNINDVKEFKDGNKEFKFDLYSVDFNDGNGGVPEPLKEASGNNKSNYFPRYSPDGKWIVFCQSENFMLLQPDSKLYIVKADGTEARLMSCNTNNMNSWHSWSPNGRWLAFASKQNGLYTQIYLTHIDANGNDSPPVLVENMMFENRAANIPEFFPGKADEFVKIKDDFSNTAAYLTRVATDNIKSHYYQRANENLNKAIALDPGYIDAYILKILLNSLLQQVNSKAERMEKEKALAILDERIAKDPSDLELLYLKATILSSVGQTQETIDLLNRIISRSPEMYKAYELLATSYKKVNKSDQVLRMYNKMKVLKPVNALDIDMLIARHFISTGRTNEALTLLRNLSAKYPVNEEIHENLFSIYSGKKEISAAQKEVNFLLSSDSANYKHYLRLAELSEIAGDKNRSNDHFSRAEILLEAELDKNKENIPLFFEKASLLQRKKDNNGAIEIYNDVLEVFPSNYTALKEKARIMLAQQQWQSAIEIYNELLNNYNAEEEFYNNSAIASIKLGNYQDALNKFTSTIELNPDNTDAYFNRSKIYNQLGDAKNANQDIETMKQLLRSKPALTAEEKQFLENYH